MYENIDLKERERKDTHIYTATHKYTCNKISYKHNYESSALSSFCFQYLK